GGVVSTTVTLNEAEALLPAASLAEHVTFVVPSANTEPEVGSQLTGSDPSTTSVAVASNEVLAPLGPVASTVLSAGTDSAGGVVSTTVTLNEAVPVLLAASVAEHVTFVVPRANVSPEP